MSRSNRFERELLRAKGSLLAGPQTVAWWRSTPKACRIWTMEPRFVLSYYFERALAQATYDKLEDGSFAGRIPPCPGVLAFSETLRKCEDELRSTLEDWILVGLKLGHPLPVIDGIDLNRQPEHESVDAL